MIKQKFVKQAKLPRDVYTPEFIDSVATYRYIGQKQYCECHPINSYDPTKYKACYECYRQQYVCCKRREEMSL